MYKYDQFDHLLVKQRVEQFRGQVARRIDGSILEEEFKPLRLQNGLYLQRHAYMLRIAIPYGMLSSNQLRTLANISTKYDRGYGHFTTRQNIQLNWVELNDVPKILEELSKVEMHAIQTSGNCIRNITSDPFAGVSADEVVDTRPVCELLRQWSTLHPEFAYLPRKFKFAINGAQEDRTVLLCHDVGIELRKNNTDELIIKANYNFIKAWTMIWRSKIKPQEYENLLLNDVHSPANFRVNIPLNNLFEKVNDKTFIEKKNKDKQIW